MCTCMCVSVSSSVCVRVHVLNTLLRSVSVVIGFVFPEACTRNDWNSPPFLCSSPALSLLYHPPFNSDYNSPLPLPGSYKDPIKKVIRTPAVCDKPSCLYHWWTLLFLSHFEFGFLSHAQSPFLPFSRGGSCASVSMCILARGRRLRNWPMPGTWKCEAPSTLWTENASLTAPTLKCQC